MTEIAVRIGLINGAPVLADRPQGGVAGQIAGQKPRIGIRA